MLEQDIMYSQRRRAQQQRQTNCMSTEYDMVIYKLKQEITVREQEIQRLRAMKKQYESMQNPAMYGNDIIVCQQEIFLRSAELESLRAQLREAQGH